MLDKIKGALYGVAVGDALGAPLEFMDAEEIRQKHGYVTEMIGGGWLNVRPGEITDDTQMTLAVAEGIAANPKEPVGEIGRRLIDWIESGPKDVGNTCRASILRAREKISSGARNDRATWQTAARAVAHLSGGRNDGNGALMRTVYPALYYADLKGALIAAADAGSMTHDSEQSLEACALYVRMIYLLTTNSGEGDVWSVLEGTRYECPEAILHLKPTGYVVDSLNCALACVRASEGFRDAVQRAANLGGDADTIAAIAGGLAGAAYGYAKIPETWVEALDPDVRGRLDALAEIALFNRERGNRME